MRKFILLLPLLLISFLSVSCVTGQYKVTPPSTYSAKKTSKIVKMSKEKLWMTLVPQVGKSFFTINNLDKSSGLMNLSYSASPDKYLDCGSVSSTVSNARGPRSYNVALSDPNTQYEYVGQNKILYSVKRNLKLEGKINIILESISPKESKISVNVRYVVSRDIIHIGGIDNNYRVIEERDFESISFDSTNDGKFRNGTSCTSNGILENELLNLIPET